MDLIDRLLEHDVWTTQQLLTLCRNLTDEQLDRDFDIGHRSVRATLSHIIRNMEVWSDLMAGHSVQEAPGPHGRSVSALMARLHLAAAELARVTRAIAKRNGWDEKWVDHLDNPPTQKTYGGAIAHVITHSMHHRAQLLYLLRRLGVDDLPEGDVLSWEHQVHSEEKPQPE
ncbi:MAG: DinB family protein [Planctomycetota bacterium]